MNNNIETILKNQLIDQKLNSKIFKTEKYLSKNYFPTSIKFREREFRQLGQLFKNLFKITENSINFFQTVTLIGPIGCGKSTVAKIFGQEIEKYAQEIDMKTKIIYRHINCRRNKSIFLILFDLMKGLIPNFPNRGFSSLELINMLHIVLNSSNSYLILTLDEIDFIFHDKELDLFFQNLSMESYENKSFLERRISLLFITRNKDFLLLLDPNNKFGIINNIIKFEKYSNSEIKQILFSKVTDSFNEGVLPFSTLEFITNVSELIGDVRTALEILWKSGKNAEQENSKIVEIVFVKKALKSVLFVELDNNWIFNSNEIDFLNFLKNNNEKISTNNQINMKSTKELFFIQYLTNIPTLEEKESIFLNIIENFEKKKILEKNILSTQESRNISQFEYYLKINPSLLLQII